MINFFHEATLRICGSLEIDDVAKNCLDFLQDYLPLDGLQMSYYDEQCRSIHMFAIASKIPLNLHDTILLSEDGHQAFKDTKETVVIYNNPEECAVPLKIWQTQGLIDKSSLVLFVMFNGTRLGQIDFFCRGRNRYTEEDAQLIKQLHNPFAIAMANSLQYREIINIKRLLSDDNRLLRDELRQMTFIDIVGARGGLKNVMKAVEQVAPLNSQVLLMGETGVGKEVIANAIHYESPRRDFPFIKVNCGAIPDGLVDTELFGHEKGAFTGALSLKYGRFERAHQGTIFLDEVGDLPAHAQARLLRVLEEKVIDRVGGTKPVKIDVRVIAATNRNLEDMVKAGSFRQDLWFRLSVFPINIPPLRERKSDIPDLLHHFIMQKTKEFNLPIPVLSPGTFDRLMAYDWPGNVREMGNVVERALIRMRSSGPNKPLVFDDFQLHESETGFGEKQFLRKIEGDLCSLDDAMRHHIQAALRRSEGKVQGPHGAAAMLGIKPNTLRHRMRTLGIPYGRQAEKT